MEIILYIIVAALLFLVVLGFKYAGEDLSKYDEPGHPLIKETSEISEAHQDVVKTLKEYHKNATLDVQLARQRMEDLFYKDMDVEVIPLEVEGVPSEWVLADGADPDRRLLYLHGGAFRVGSPKSHRYITAELSRLAGVAVLAIDYRMQPEYKIKHCHEDARTAYRWILENGPKGSTPAKSIFVAGDSAGGNLTLSTINYAKDAGLRLPNAAIGLAPATDATFTSPTWTSNMDTDPFLGPGLGRMFKLPLFLLRFIQRLAAGVSPADPMVSPLRANLSGLCPTLIQVSCDEMLYGDALRYYNKANAEGGDVTLQVWPTLVHVFQGFGPDLPEAVDALERIASFIKDNDVEASLSETTTASTETT